MGNDTRGHSQEALEKVRTLTTQGYTQAAIAQETGVPVRTQRDWKFRGLLEGTAPPPPESWPSERQWPGWTVDDVAGFGMSDFKQGAWEGNLAMVRTAENNGNHYVGWFFRRLVDIGRNPDAPEGHPNWALALAGLPVLGVWLNCPPCNDLAALIEERRPWQGGIVVRQRQRARYEREARSVAAAVKQCLISAQAQMVLSDLAKNQLAPGAVLLAALAEHIPLFDRVPRRSPYRKFNLGGIILGILVLPKEAI